MKTRLFYTDGKKNLFEEEWNKPEPKANEIEVKSIMTGVCRSDIDMHVGAFQLLPKTIQGHESIGIVSKVGKEITHIKEGDFVATRGEPAFADFYNCANHMFVPITELEPKYILEPVACGINIAMSLTPETDDDILMLGSGFLSTVVYTTLQRYYDNHVVVVGSANMKFWKKQQNVTIITDPLSIKGKKYNYIIDLSDKPEYLDLNVYNSCAKIVLAAEKHPKAVTSFAEFLWNAVDISFPSPRNSRFYDYMILAEELIRYNEIETNGLWTKSYDRESEIKLAFEEGINRPPGYSRGYIEWQK